MRFVSVTSYDEWREAAREELRAGTLPEEVSFSEETSQPLLFVESNESRTATAVSSVIRVPKSFLDIAPRIACHRSPARFDLLYRVLWRLTTGEPHLLADATDDDASRLHAMEKSVRRDAHKMKAFVRFRRVETPDGEHYIAWHQPDHRVLGLTAPFFARRFTDMNWTIFTPDESAAWDGTGLQMGPGIPQSHAPASDELDDLWRTYYANIFNPARVKYRAMVREMPVRYWHTMPETELIPDLLRTATAKVSQMVDRPSNTKRSAADYLPEKINLKSLREAAEHCKGCDLYKDATQTVFGEGKRAARLVLVGEQPGDEEDRQGHPFVGPAGRVLDDALEAAGINRKDVYVTNAVKHFKFISRGVRRLHKKPGAREMAACSPWLHAELATIKPEFLVCLGATAAQALLGRSFRITQDRGKIIATEWCEATMATYHPSAVLRAPDSARRDELRKFLVSDLKRAAGYLG